MFAIKHFGFPDDYPSQCIEKAKESLQDSNS